MLTFHSGKHKATRVAEKKTNLMSFAIFISLLMYSTCFGH